MKTYVIDIDGTICTNTFGEYEKAKPFFNRIAFINKLYDEGNIIKFFTARGSSTKIDWTEITKKQLSAWKVKYHQLLLGKPEGDIFIDDKAFNSERWDWNLNDFEIDKDLNRLNISLKKNIETFYSILANIETKEMILKVANAIKFSLRNNGKLFLAGNGGSFSDAQHIATEFVARYKTDRIPIPSIALGTNSSNLTAIGNDFGFDDIFSRELQALANKDDVLIALSTSGNSKNILNLVSKAADIGMDFFIFTGMDGGKLGKYTDKCLFIPSLETSIIQQCHISILHLIVEISEQGFI